MSGGQTGADRAALDFALENGIAIGGYVPNGRPAEDGKIPAKYVDLIETESADSAQRTKLNVIHSDATLIFSHGILSSGSKLTQQLAVEHDKPLLHIDLLEQPQNTIAVARKWLAVTDCPTLNVAGPRISEDAAIYNDVLGYLRQLFADH